MSAATLRTAAQPSTSAAASPPRHAADVDRMWAARQARLDAEAAAPWPVKLARRVRTAWFQYLITVAAYCFDWWERLIVHALVLGGAVLGFYGLSLVWRGAGVAWRTAAVALAAAGKG